MELRDYQITLRSKITEAAKNGHKKILLMAPTGGGKTVIAKSIIDSAIEKGNKVIFTVPRIVLIEQTAKRFEDPSIIQGNDNRFDNSKLLQIATIHTLINRDVTDVKIVIIDEVHYGYDGELIQSIFNRFDGALFIGMSATPVDNRGYLLDGWDTIIDEVQTCDLIDRKQLLPLEVYSCVKLPLDKIKTDGVDYNESELEPIVCEPHVLHTVLENYKKHAHGLKFIGFCVNKSHAIKLTTLFNDNGYTTEYVTADTPDETRDKIFYDLKNGLIDGVFSIEILTMGFDDGSIMCELMCCPTKSWRKLIQCVGRVIRLNGANYEESVKNGKSKALYLDFGNTIIEHGMPTDRKKLIFKPKTSKVVDRLLGLDSSNEKRKEIAPERVEFLKKIGSLIDLYDGKVYDKEDALQDDVNSFLEKTDYFWWRQNSGKMFKDGRWVHFTSKHGLPDSTMFFNMTSVYIGIELKTTKGVLTDYQKQTIPEMLQRGVLVFFAQSILDVFEIILHCEDHIIRTDDTTIIKDTIYQYPERQIKYFKKYFGLNYVKYLKAIK